jgi:putative protease
MLTRGTDIFRRRPELLAPAGDWDALRAAVANGADAVYFGLPRFNARHRATNFTADELPEVLHYLHRRNVRGYVAFNTLVFSDELPDAIECLNAAAAAGADAVIVQDLGLVRLIRRLVPTLPVHASTQMTLTEPHGIEFVRALGVERVILARELSLPEIERVAGQTPMPLEVFVHGALCVAYSGQCLTSEALGGRSANRGQCAQACRLPYEMVVDGTPRDLGDRAYLLSPQDLEAAELVEPLAKAGVVSLKIEGRLKGAPYVAATVQTYRAAIDATAADRPFALSAEARRDLTQVYSRGFSPGFLEGVDHQRLVQGRFPKHRGVRLGTVVGSGRRGVAVELADGVEIRPGDGVVFDEGRPEDEEKGGRVYEVRVSQSPPVATGGLGARRRRVELTFARGGLDPRAVPAGALVWKTDDPVLRQRLEHSYATDVPARRSPLHAEVRGAVGQPLAVTVRDAEGHAAAATWPGPLEEARKHPATAESLRESFARLGDTPFGLATLTADLGGSVMIPKSVLNDLRRQAVTRLLEQRDAGHQHPIAEPDALDRLRSTIPAVAALSTQHSALSTLSVLVRSLEQLDAVLAWVPPAPLARPELVYCDFEDLRRYREAVDRARAAGMPVGLATLRIQKPGEEGHLRQIAGSNPDVLLIRNLAGLVVYREEAPGIRLVGDFSLNVANELTADLLWNAGLERLVPGYDLNWEQLATLADRCDPTRFEVVVHQHVPMFHMEHCVFAAFLSDGKDWRDCGRPCDRHKVELRDRVGAAFPVLADTGCRNTVFNALPQSAAEYLPRMRAVGLRHFRVELLRETPQQVGPLLERYARVLAGMDDGRDTWRQLRALNQVGLTRGTLQLV